MTTWNDARLHIRGLFPKFAPTQQEGALITKTLATLPADRVIAAADRYRCEEVGVVFRLTSFLAVYKLMSQSAQGVDPSVAIEECDAALDVEKAQAVRRLKLMPTADIEIAVRELNRRKWFTAQIEPNDIDAWSRNVVFLISAIVENEAAQ
jgi:hypothetical protein